MNPRNTSLPIRVITFAYIALCLLAYAWFKWWYPYPSLFPDSYSYLEAAATNQSINMWPIGYSRFLQVLGPLAHISWVLTLIQYELLQLAVLYFIFTMNEVLRLERWQLVVLLIFGLVNPLLLHVANFVSADALYTSMSIIWLAQLFRIIYRPTKGILYTHWLVLLIAFMARYNALYYPVISIVVILGSKVRRGQKAVSITAILLSIGVFVGHTMYEYKQETGHAQFSAFGGWQLAANALLPYTYAPQISDNEVPPKFRELHKITNETNAQMSRVPNRPDQILGVHFLWKPESPLVQYLTRHFKGQPKTANEYFRQWASYGPLYGSYGMYLTKRYPMEYVQYHLWPNFVRYYVPPAEFLDEYNMRRDTLDKVGSDWFHVKKVPIRSATKDIYVIKPYPYIQAFTNLLFLLSFIAFALLDGIKKYNKVITWWAVFIWSANLGFSVLASPIVLRYQVFPLLLALVFTIQWLTYIIRESMGSQTRPQPS
jgi:hypothetical protein